MDVLLNYFRTLPRRQVVRPWALAVPILVLLVALPLLRPLRSPEPYNISSNELSRLAAIQAMGEEHRQEIDNSAYYAALRNRDFRHPPETGKATVGRYVFPQAGGRVLPFRPQRGFPKPYRGVGVEQGEPARPPASPIGPEVLL